MITEGTHTLPDGLQLYTKTWKPKGLTRAVLVFIHGFNDHCKSTRNKAIPPRVESFIYNHEGNAYYDFFPSLASSGLEVRAFDQRGWGRSVQTPKDRGNTGDTSQVLSDMHSFITSTATTNTPLFLLGHSMGGGQALTYILHPSSPYHTTNPKVKLSGVLVWAPLITLNPSSQPWKVTLIAGRLASRILPRWQRYAPLDPGLISRDEKVVEDYKADGLRHDIGTLEGLRGMLDRGVWLDQAGVDVYERAGLVPLWLGHGVCDGVTSFEGTKALAERLGVKGDVTFVGYEGAFHTLHAELGETTGRFVEDVVGWVLARCPDGQRDRAISGVTEDEVKCKAKL